MTMHLDYIATLQLEAARHPPSFLPSLKSAQEKDVIGLLMS